MGNTFALLGGGADAVEGKPRNGRTSWICRRPLEREPMSDVCREFGVSRKTGYKFLNRYLKEGSACPKSITRAETATPRSPPAGASARTAGKSIDNSDEFRQAMGAGAGECRQANLGQCSHSKAAAPRSVRCRIEAFTKIPQARSEICIGGQGCVR